MNYLKRKVRLSSFVLMLLMASVGCTSKVCVQSLKPLPPPAWMVQDPPDWRKTLNKI
ncbi:hypothetical protein FE392_19350, partial [Xenorhabdus sp. 12]|nr:hypothetical protein [Xenorhabdus sp. 12]